MSRWDSFPVGGGGSLGAVRCKYVEHLASIKWEQDGALLFFHRRIRRSSIFSDVPPLQPRRSYPSHWFIENGTLFKVDQALMELASCAGFGNELTIQQLWTTLPYFATRPSAGEPVNCCSFHFSPYSPTSFTFIILYFDETDWCICFSFCSNFE